MRSFPIFLGEGCVYVVSDTGVQKTDFVLDRFLARNWQDFLSSDDGYLAETYFISPPRRLLQTIKKDCNPALGGHGFLPKLGYRSLFNFSQLLHGQEVSDAVLEAQE